MKFMLKELLICAVFFFSIVMIGCGGDSPTSTEKKPPPEDTTKTQPPAASDIHLWLTKADQSTRFQEQNISLEFSHTNDSNPAITVDTTQSYQSMDGFGFALTGASEYVIYSLAPDQRKALLQELFKTDSMHIGISYLRVSIGASDLSQNVFSYDDLSQGQTDTELQKFNLGVDRYNVIPLLKEIVAINPNIKIVATPWSAPVWMKTNDSSIGGSLQPQYYDVYAQYFVKYIQAMQSNGIPITAVTPQNEPLYGGNNPSMVMQADEENTFVKNSLGPAFESAGLDTKIIVYDHNADRPDYPLTILADADTRKYVAGSAFHLYGGDISALSQVHDAYPNKKVYFTELYTASTGDFAGDLKYHLKNLIIGASRNWSKNVIEWNLASDSNYGPHTPGGCSTCKGALTIGSSITRNVSYYIVASASKFVRPGSHRIASNIVGPLQNVAFKTPDSRKVLIVLNDDDSKQTFDIKFAGESVTTSLEGGSVGTYVWK